MSATPEDVQARIDAAMAEIKQATTAPAKMVAQHGDNPNYWSAGHLRTGFLDLIAARAEVGDLVAPPPVPTPIPTPPPPVAAGTGLALIAYGGTLRSMSHLTDGTYDVVVASWSDAALLSTVSGDGFAYTVTTAGVAAANAVNYVILDPLGNSSLAGALKPDDYIAKCAALKAVHPGLKGIFLDNNVAFGKVYNPPVPTAQLVDILAHVAAGLAAHGLKWCSNTGSYVSGDHGSDDGSIWRNWAWAIEPSFDRILFENWQQASAHNPPVKRLRGTDAWYKHWDDFQKCVAAVPGKFFGASYAFAGDLSFGTYGRASMLTAAGADPRNVFFSNVNYQYSDPINQPWAKRSPDPKVDPVAGTASL